MSGCAKCDSPTDKRLCRQCALEDRHGTPRDHFDDEEDEDDDE